jgi:hypothetical protein
MVLLYILMRLDMNKEKTKKLFIPLLIAVLIGAVFYAYYHNRSNPQGPVIAQPSQTYYVSGYVVCKRSPDEAWLGIEADVGLEDNALLKTAKGSSVEVRFGKDMNNVISAQEDTLIKLDKIAAKGDKQITLTQGRLISDLEELDSESSFEVRTPTAVCGVLGTSFETITDQDQTIVKVYKGNVYVRGKGLTAFTGKEVLVREGKQTTIDKSQAPAYPISISQEDMALWQEWKDGVPGRMFRTFYVFRDEGDPENHYYPSGWLGDYDAIRRFSWEDNPRLGKNCLRFRYTARTPQGAGWAGVHWQNPVNNWGDVEGGYNLTGATKLLFWVRGEKGGEKIVRFGVGGISGKYPDSCTAEIGPVVLTDQWRQYSIDLSAKDLTYISGGFYWMTDKNSNPDGATFYLDDIRYE